MPNLRLTSTFGSKIKYILHGRDANLSCGIVLKNTYGSGPVGDYSVYFVIELGFNAPSRRMFKAGTY